MEYKFYNSFALLILQYLLNKSHKSFNVKVCLETPYFSLRLFPSLFPGQTYNFQMLRKCAVFATLRLFLASHFLHTHLLLLTHTIKHVSLSLSTPTIYKHSMKDITTKQQYIKKLILVFLFFLRLFIQYAFSYKVMPY